MKVKELANKSDKELAAFVTETQARVANLIIESRTKESKNVKAILGARKDLARALTISRQRALSEQEKTNA